MGEDGLVARVLPRHSGDKALASRGSHAHCGWPFLSLYPSS